MIKVHSLVPDITNVHCSVYSIVVTYSSSSGAERIKTSRSVTVQAALATLLYYYYFVQTQDTFIDSIRRSRINRGTRLYL